MVLVEFVIHLVLVLEFVLEFEHHLLVLVERLLQLLELEHFLEELVLLVVLVFVQQEQQLMFQFQEQ